MLERMVGQMPTEDLTLIIIGGVIVILSLIDGRFNSKIIDP